MRYYLFILIILLLSCKMDSNNNLLNPSNLQSYYVKVDHKRDELIRTPKGAAIFIKEGTFDRDTELEIKEAYTMKDIVLAGLITETNGRSMRSGGMVYINTTNGSAPLLKPIQVLLPANYIEDSMKLYKGEVTDEENINWVEADTLMPTINQSAISIGSELFLRNCSNCHRINRPLTGPPLAGFWTRGPWEENLDNIVSWIHNPGAFIPRTGYTRNLQIQYGSIMPGFPQLTKQDVFSIIEFIRNESSKPITDTFKTPLSTIPADTIGIIKEPIAGVPCMDTFYMEKEDTLDPMSNDEVYEAMEVEGGTVTWESAMRSGFQDNMISDGAYRFEIQTLGWYNIDVEVAPLPNTILCDLTVSIDGNGNNNGIIVYAFFPWQKNLSVGELGNDGKYKFQKVGGKIPLYMDEPGIIIAFGNNKDDFYLGIKKFTVQQQQEIEVGLEKSTKEDFLNAIEQEEIEGINMDMIQRQMKIIPCDQGTNRDTAIML